LNKLRKKALNIIIQSKNKRE